MTGLLEVSVMSGTFLAGIAWMLVALLSRRYGGTGSGSARAEAFLGRTWLFAPVWVPAVLLGAAFLPGLLGSIGIVNDHCVGHDAHHHLCLLHPPHASDHVLGWFLPLIIVLPAAGLFATCVRRARTELQLARTLVALSRPSDLGPDVRLLDRDESVAITVGLRRPTILLSTGLLERVSETTVAVVVAHERAHVVRRDTRQALLERLMASVFPRTVGRALVSRISLARERACDAAAACVAGGPVAVAQALAEVARAQVRVPETGVSIASAALEDRARHLLEPSRDSRRWILGVGLVLGALVAAGAGPVHDAAERLVHFLIH